MFHDAIMTPMDVVKQRLQLGHHKGMLDCVLTIRRTEGTQVGVDVDATEAYNMPLVVFPSFFIAGDDNSEAVAAKAVRLVSPPAL